MMAKCISNESRGMQFYGIGTYGYAPYGRIDGFYHWLEIGKLYEVIQVTGQIFYDSINKKTIDMLTVKYKVDNKIGISNVPANLFKDLGKWRDDQINKILNE